MLTTGYRSDGSLVYSDKVAGGCSWVKYGFQFLFSVVAVNFLPSVAHVSALFSHDFSFEKQAFKNRQVYCQKHVDKQSSSLDYHLHVASVASHTNILMIN